MRRSLRTMLVGAAVFALGLTAVPGNAAGLQVCQVAATVTLDAYENLLQVNGGSGNLAGSMLCEGSAPGASLTLSGRFTFCLHSPSGHGSATDCQNLPNQDTEAVADTVSGIVPIVSHVLGNISIPFSTGGSCNMMLDGHTYGVQADLSLRGFTCTGGFGAPSGAEIARAEATAAIVIDPTVSACTPGPGGAKACFKQVAFAGTVVGVDLT